MDAPSTLIPDPVQRVRELALSIAPGAEGDTVFIEAVDAGIGYREHMDAGRWALGDLTALLQSRYPHFVDSYGKGIVENFAREVHARARTLYEYAETARFYPDGARRAVSSIFPMLSYSHYRAAMRLSTARERAEGLDACRAKALEALSHWAVNGLTADQADREVAIDKGKVAAPLATQRVTAAHGTLVLRDERFRDGTSYEVQVFEVTA